MRTKREQMGLLPLGVLVSLMAVWAVLAGCGAHHATEAERFLKSVKQAMPFGVDTMYQVGSRGMATFRFFCASPVLYEPDVEVDGDGKSFVSRTTLAPRPSAQAEDAIWRNVRVSRKNRRVVCIDRYQRGGQTDGYVYVFQSETKRFPTYGIFHWDVSDPRNMELAGVMLGNLDALAAKRLKSAGTMQAPASQDDYWRLIFHADSLFDDGRHAEAMEAYDLAFTDDRYILPSQLTTTAMKMCSLGDRRKALDYLRHRIAMEQDYYMEPAASPFPELTDTFAVRSARYGYDLQLKQQLEWVLERDQHDRMRWQQAASAIPQDAGRTELLARRALDTDSTNQRIVAAVLASQGFPSRRQVGEMAAQAVWLVFQHADLDSQSRFLPQLQEAVSRGDIAPLFLAMLQDRIDVREGRPQRYGTQTGADGRLCQLLDATKVNEWRAEVGLPPIDLP